MRMKTSNNKPTRIQILNKFNMLFINGDNLLYACVEKEAPANVIVSQIQAL